MAGDLLPQFIDGPQGPLFVLRHGPPPEKARGAVLFLPPFAEEHNRSRRMAHLMGQALAARNVATFLLDPHGTGDSAGEFQQARWAIWKADAQAAMAWLRATGYEKLSLLGLRLGACLALDAMDSALERLVLWQPVPKGSTFLTQFLRIRVSAGFNKAMASAGGVQALRDRLTAGESLEVAGYVLSPELAADLEGLNLEALGDQTACPIHWFQVGGDQMSPAVDAVLDVWQARGGRVTAHVVPGPAFWSIEETTIAPSLITATAGLWDVPS
ncbi:hydrolase 2, exosortase A system-associated [Magnetospira thiophila]